MENIQEVLIIELDFSVSLGIFYCSLHIIWGNEFWCPAIYSGSSGTIICCHRYLCQTSVFYLECKYCYFTISSHSTWLNTLSGLVSILLPFSIFVSRSLAANPFFFRRSDDFSFICEKIRQGLTLISDCRL